MLNVSAGRAAGIHRRSFVQAGILGVGGLMLADLLRAQARAGTTHAENDRSVILFWMSGGPGHMETWDPKPKAVDQYRGPFGAIPTNVPGVQFGELLPEQAKLMDRVSIVRSVKHGTGDHTKGNHWMLTGYEGPDFNAPDNKVQRRPAMGSAVAKLVGPNEPGMPPYVAVPHLRRDRQLFPLCRVPRGRRQSVHRQLRSEQARLPRRQPRAATRSELRPPGAPPLAAGNARPLHRGR